MLGDVAFWLGLAVGGILGVLVGIPIGIRLYLRTGRW
jgi:hypothetical protein